jgi:hypothetical protein
MAAILFKLLIYCAICARNHGLDAASKDPAAQRVRFAYAVAANETGDSMKLTPSTSGTFAIVLTHHISPYSHAIPS